MNWIAQPIKNSRTYRFSDTNSFSVVYNKLNPRTHSLLSTTPTCNFSFSRDVQVAFENLKALPLLQCLSHCAAPLFEQAVLAVKIGCNHSSARDDRVACKKLKALWNSCTNGAALDRLIKTLWAYSNLQLEQKEDSLLIENDSKITMSALGKSEMHSWRHNPCKKYAYFFKPPASETILRHSWTFHKRSRSIQPLLTRMLHKIQNGRRQPDKTHVTRRAFNYRRLSDVYIFRPLIKITMVPPDLRAEVSAILNIV